MPLGHYSEGMILSEKHDVAAIQPESDATAAAFAFAVHLDRAKGGGIDVNVELFDGGHQHVPAIGLAPQNGREQASHRRAPDRRAFVVPGPVSPDAHSRMAAAIRVPPIDRRQLAILRELLEIVEAYSLEFGRRIALGHRRSLDCFVVLLKAGYCTNGNRAHRNCYGSKQTRRGGDRASFAG